MSDILPYKIDPHEYNEWYAIRLAQCYRPHTPIPTKEELMNLEPYQTTGHCSLQSLTEDVGLDYIDEINSRR